MKAMKKQGIRSQLGRLLGHGRAREWLVHWWLQRLTAVALVPLTIWFVASIIAHTASDYERFITWLSTPLTTTCMTLFLIAMFYHTALGLQVVIEDYIHSAAKVPLLVAMR